jgi:DNA adenine methylase
MPLKPCWKWAGGKQQLMPILDERVRRAIDTPVIIDGNACRIGKYAEPFVGAGALFWHVMDAYDDVIKRFYISDVNAELINTYKVIRDDCDRLCGILSSLADEYLPKDEDARKDMYYRQRDAYNALMGTYHGEYHGADATECAALFLFLNRTCFNGLYRTTKNGKFNVPAGRYKSPCICDADALHAASAALRGHDVLIMNVSYDWVLDWADARTLVYFDPPYRPITSSSAFTAYAKSGFNDDDQRRLAETCDELDDRGVKVMMSNSDPHNTNPDDDFFDDLYGGSDADGNRRYVIDRVHASRNINSNGSGRGKVSEILVTNF